MRPFFAKTKKETAKYYPARTRVRMTGVTKDELVRVLKPVANGVLEHLPANVKVALRWYAKGITEESPVDKFISLYEPALAVVGAWHNKAHPEAYVDEEDPERGRDPPPRRMFGDWVRDELSPPDKTQEALAFRPYHRMVGVRNKVLKGGAIDLNDEDVLCAVECSVQLLNWCLGQCGTTD